jgi:uncharacterized membrane protein
MFVHVAMGILPAMLALDVFYHLGAGPALWIAAGYLALVGVAFLALTAITGAIDLSAVPDDTRAHTIGALHATSGLLVLAMAGVSLLLRWPLGSDPANVPWVTIADVVGTALIPFQGWSGGEMVYRHHVGVLERGEGGDPISRGPGKATARDAPRPGGSRRA